MGRPPPPSFGQCPKENVFFPLMSSLTNIYCALHFHFRTPTRKHAMLEKLIVNRNLETLLGTIFQPQNAHCIHIDPKVCQDFQLRIWWWTIVPITYFNSKADPVFLKTVEQLISCYRYSNTSTNIQGTVREIEIHGDSPLQCIVTEEKYSICLLCLKHRLCHRCMVAVNVVEGIECTVRDPHVT